MTDNFLRVGGGSSDVTNGSTAILGSTIGATNLSASRPLKTDTFKRLISSNLEISEINGLQAELDSLGGTWNRVAPDVTFDNAGDKLAVTTHKSADGAEDMIFENTMDAQDNIKTDQISESTTSANITMNHKTIHTSGIQDDTLTASTLVRTDAQKNLESITDLNDHFTGGTNITITGTDPLTISNDNTQATNTGDDVTFNSVTGTNLTASKLVETDGANKLVSVSDLSGHFTAGNSISITGTDPLTIDTIQDIRTTAGPTFQDVTVNSATASRFVELDSNKKLVASTATGFINDNTFATATATNIPSALSVKTYVAGESRPPGGVANSIQYNDGANGFAGSANLTYDGTNLDSTGNIRIDATHAMYCDSFYERTAGQDIAFGDKVVATDGIRDQTLTAFRLCQTDASSNITSLTGVLPNQGLDKYVQGGDKITVSNDGLGGCTIDSDNIQALNIADDVQFNSLNLQTHIDNSLIYFAPDGTLAFDNKLKWVTGTARMDILTGATNNSNFHMGPNANEGAYITSVDDTNMILSGGVEVVSGNYVARATTASYINIQNGEVKIYADTGLTDGVAYTPTLKMQINTGQTVVDSIQVDTGLTLSGETANKLLALDGSKVAQTVDLNSYVAGSANQITVTDDGDGSITLSTPQDIAVTSTPTFGGITLQATTAVTGILDEDKLVSDSAVSLATQQSIKAYHDANALVTCSGVISGFDITDNGDGTIDVASGVCLIKTSNDDTEVPTKFAVSGVTGLTMATNSETYIYVDYDGGTPSIKQTTTLGGTVKDNENSLFEIAEIVRNTTTALHIIPHAQTSANATGKVQQFLYDLHNTVRTSGLIMSEPSALALAVSAGVLWTKLSKVNLSAFDSSGSDTFDYYYDDGAGGHTAVLAQSTVSNTQYDDGTGTLANLNINRYGFHEVYAETDGSVVIVYGNVNSAVIGAAESAPIITDLPFRLTGSQYVGRIIVQQGNANIVSFLSAFTQTLNFSSATDHGALSGLGDDDHSQYALLTGRVGDVLNIEEINTGNLVIDISGSSEQILHTDEEGGLTVGCSSGDAPLVLKSGTTFAVLSNANKFQVDEINEYTTSAGVEVGGTNFKSTAISMPNGGLITPNINPKIQATAVGGGSIWVGPHNNGDGLIYLQRITGADNACVGTVSDGIFRFLHGQIAGDENWHLYNTQATAESLEVTPANLMYSEAIRTNAIAGADVHINTTTGLLGYDSSLMAHKMNIETLADASWVYSLRPVQYHRRAQERTIVQVPNDDQVEHPQGSGTIPDTIPKASNVFTDNPEPELELGFIAEEIEQVNPDLCFYTDEVAKTGLVSVRTKSIITGLVKIVQDQKKTIDQQVLELTAIKARLEALEHMWE